MAALSDHAQKLLLDWLMTTPGTIGNGDKLNFAIGSVTLTLA